jgi:GNAT superfamily N-acetyltransferase
MKIEVVENSAATPVDYAAIPIAFEAREAFDVIAEADGGVRLKLRALPVPYVKDYDAISETPTQWADRFDVSKWGFFSAFSGLQCVGRAAVARETSSLEMLEGRSDLALLWDIRVAPEARRHGVGSVLFDTAVKWALSKGCLQLMVETQNVNVAACRFYAQRGCTLQSVRRDAYPDFPDEIQLLWVKSLLRRSDAG